MLPSLVIEFRELHDLLQPLTGSYRLDALGRAVLLEVQPPKNVADAIEHARQIGADVPPQSGTAA